MLILSDQLDVVVVQSEGRDLVARRFPILARV
jgi:hypothetical protein